jgi:hypothetical protein
MFTQPQTKPTILTITTNSIVTKHNKLVMGAGAAQQARDSHPGLDLAAGKKLLEKGLAGKQYGLLKPIKELNILLFQVKIHWGEPADIELIRYSTEILTGLASRKPELEFWLNYPGIGSGKLDMADVEPVLSILPDNVVVWKL